MRNLFWAATYAILGGLAAFGASVLAFAAALIFGAEAEVVDYFLSGGLLLTLISFFICLGYGLSRDDGIPTGDGRRE